MTLRVKQVFSFFDKSDRLCDNLSWNISSDTAAKRLLS